MWGWQPSSSIGHDNSCLDFTMKNGFETQHILAFVCICNTGITHIHIISLTTKLGRAWIKKLYPLPPSNNNFTGPPPSVCRRNEKEK